MVIAYRSVLIVEDDKSIRFALTLALESEGYPVIQACHGEEALEILASLSEQALPGCILLDLLMPVMDGTTFLACLQKDQPAIWERVPIVIVTAKKTVISPDQIHKLEILQKPINLDDLYRAVGKYCNPE